MIILLAILAIMNFILFTAEFFVTANIYGDIAIKAYNGIMAAVFAINLMLTTCLIIKSSFM